ncbi:hypothetical protein O6H91_16G074200 [Diphasiastrum complanatum]|nr:hypothetical protein O6H91_16G074200 [Diphasiastrum complanatum]
MNQEMLRSSNTFSLSGFLNFPGASSSSDYEEAGLDYEWKESAMCSITDNALAMESDRSSMEFMLDLVRSPEGMEFCGSKDALSDSLGMFEENLRDACFPGVGGGSNKATVSATYRLFSRGVETSLNSAGDSLFRQIDFSLPVQDFKSVRSAGCSTSLNSPAAAAANSPESKNSIVEPCSVLDLAISPEVFSQSGHHHQELIAAAKGPIMLGAYCEMPSQRSVSLDVCPFRPSSDIVVLSPAACSSLPSPVDAWAEPLLYRPELKPDVVVSAGEEKTVIVSDSCSDHNQSGSDEQSASAIGSPAAELSCDSRQEGCFTELQRDKINQEEIGMELVNLLLACGEAVSNKNLSLVNPLIARLGELASPDGSSMQRVAAYFTEGLACRISRTWPQIYEPLPFELEIYYDDDYLAAFHILNHVCPYIKFAHFTANDVFVQAFEGEERVHIIDFDIKQGLQWPALFQSLAVRPGGPPAHVRITGIGECREDVQETGARLAEFAESLNLPFEFHAVIDKLEDVRLWMLHVKDKESVAVNCIMQLHKTLHDSGNGIEEIFDLIKSTKPKVVALVEQEANHNGPTFQSRFLEALNYYAAIFDSLDSCLPPTSDARLKVEQLFAQEIRNILACEGTKRVVRHEKIERWSNLMIQAGFDHITIKPQTITQARLLLEMFSCKNYTLKEMKGSLMLGWQDKFLYSASAWSPKH